MPFCGYDPLMGEGVAQFAEGLIASMSAKARERGFDLRRQLSEERTELQCLINRLSEDVTSLGPEEPLLAIVLLVQHLMQPETDYKNARELFEKAVRGRARQLDDRMQLFEKAFYGASPAAPLSTKVELALEASYHTGASEAA